MKKILLVLLSLLLCVACFSACKKEEESNIIDLPVAPSNPNITHPEGEFYIADKKPHAMGGLSVLGKDFLKIMIEGKEREFVLSDKAKEDIAYYNKDENNLRIMKGTMLIISYHERNLIYVADSVEIVTGN